MPKTVFQKLGIGEAKPTTVMLQLADHSFVQPEGKIEDILVRIFKFIFSTDFLILDFEADEHAPIILGRPFLATGRVLLDLGNNELIFSVDDQHQPSNLHAQDPARRQPQTNCRRPKETKPSHERCSKERNTKMARCRLAGKPFYSFLDGYSGYNQIAIAPEDQSKTTFTCPYETFAFRRMPFGLCNAPGTFQRCMTTIFSDMNEDCLEIFMDDFSTFGDDFDSCLNNLEKVLTRCEESNLVLNWEKCHFMVDEGIVLDHKISSRGMEVDRAKIDVISKLPPPTTAFEILKNKPVTTPIVAPPDWTLPFELMCDVSDYAVGAVLGQRKGKIFHPIYYASKTLNHAQVNYTTTEKELMAVIFAFDKFRSHLIGAKVTVYTDHSAIKYMLSKKDAKPR
ncbi:hypothetical protein V6N12_012960 [Hibiscus sabdariffa]|uniref:RNA-directed DNA polymerase n=1 Tax=Hibiscus sabdariffa TaxID=183260 RepID=A0ABR2EJN4_9ROSI